MHHAPKVSCLSSQRTQKSARCVHATQFVERSAGPWNLSPTGNTLVWSFSLTRGTHGYNSPPFSFTSIFAEHVNEARFQLLRGLGFAGSTRLRSFESIFTIVSIESSTHINDLIHTGTSHRRPFTMSTLRRAQRWP